MKRFFKETAVFLLRKKESQDYILRKFNPPQNLKNKDVVKRTTPPSAVS
jgi:hypothetical protein